MEYVVNPTEHLGLLRTIVKPLVRRGVPIEDTEVYSEAMIGLLRACQTFDPSRGYKFSTYARPVIFREMQGAWKQRFRRNRAYLGHPPSSQTPERQSCFSYSLRDEDCDQLQHAVSQLPEQQRKLIELRLQGLDCTQAGRQMGVTRQRAWQIYQSTLLKLRESFRD